LLLEEEADHLSLAVGLDLLARDYDEITIAGRLYRLERAAEHVVVGHGDPAEPDALGVIEKVLDLDRAVVRPARVQMQVDRDPVAIREWVRVDAALPPLACEARVHGVELSSDDVEALRLGKRSCVRGERVPAVLVGSESCDVLRERDGGA